MAKSNYGQVKRQKEAARKARQQEKLDRRRAELARLPVNASEAGRETGRRMPGCRIFWRLPPRENIFACHMPTSFLITWRSKRFSTPGGVE